MIPAAVLANGPVTIVGIPQIADVANLAEILRMLNVEVTEVGPDHLIIDPTYMQNIDLTSDAVTKLRASYYFMGALLGKYGHAQTATHSIQDVRDSQRQLARLKSSIRSTA